MTEFKEILVPIDFSEVSERAVEPAYSLTKLIGGKVYLLHVLDMMPRPNPLYSHYAPRESMMKDDIDKMEAEARKKLLSLIPEDKEYENVATEVLVVRHERADECIVEQADKLGVDIIIMTHKGWSSLAHLVLGSVAEKVLRHARCPVMLMRR